MDQINAASRAMRDTNLGRLHALSPTLLRCDACGRFEMIRNPTPGTCPVCRVGLVPVVVRPADDALKAGAYGLMWAA